MIATREGFGGPFLLKESLVLCWRGSEALDVVEIVFRPVLSCFLRAYAVSMGYAWEDIIKVNVQAPSVRDICEAWLRWGVVASLS